MPWPPSCPARPYAWIQSIGGLASASAGSGASLSEALPDATASAMTVRSLMRNIRARLAVRAGSGAALRSIVSGAAIGGFPGPVEWVSIETGDDREAEEAAIVRCSALSARRRSRPVSRSSDGSNADSDSEFVVVEGDEEDDGSKEEAEGGGAGEDEDADEDEDEDQDI